MRATDVIRIGTLLSWSIWFAVVTATNFCDALKALGVLGPSWAFASGNFASILEVTARYGTPVALSGVMFASVIVWEAAATIAFAVATVHARRETPGSQATAVAFAMSLALWSAFVVIDEFFVSYEFAGAHRLLFVATFVSYIGVELIDRRRAAA